MREIREDERLGPSTGSMIEEAEARVLEKELAKKAKEAKKKEEE